jgi:succinyl-CoA synthetase beta subunit
VAGSGCCACSKKCWAAGCDKTPAAMKVHEYQAKEIVRRYGVPTPRGIVIDSPEEARQAAKDLGGRVVVKAQIHAGGRGKGGGVKLAKDPDEAVALAKQIIGMNLVTHQTGPAGQVVRKVLVEEALNIDKELYLGITLDRRSGMNVIMASAQGGMDIEEVAAHDPNAIHREPVDSVLGVQPFQARQVAYALGLSGQAYKASTSCRSSSAPTSRPTRRSSRSTRCW